MTRKQAKKNRKPCSNPDCASADGYTLILSPCKRCGRRDAEAGGALCSGCAFETGRCALCGAEKKARGRRA